MIKYFTEAEDTNLDPMDVQVGPQEEIEANAEKIECDPGAEAACAAKNPVEEAKKDPNTIPVAGITKSGVQEFYVDAADIEKYAELHEKTMLESLNDLIACHEEAGMSADNIVVVMSEGTEGYIHNLEKHGAACVSFVNEADDVTVDVQVGPEGEEVTVKEDPQEANPVDAVKRQYDSVVVAKDDDKFFMDVEDVQKCAEINNESVIETLNNIINVNEEFDMCPENIVLICNEETSEELLDELSEAGVFLEAGLKSGDLSWNRWIKAVKIKFTQMKDKFNKVEDADKKALQARLNEVNDTMTKIDEEIEKVNKNPDLEIKYVQKMAAYYGAFMAAYMLILRGLMPAGSFFFGSKLKTLVTGFGFGEIVMGNGIKGYVEYLGDVKHNLEKVKKELESKISEKEEKKPESEGKKDEE